MMNPKEELELLKVRTLSELIYDTFIFLKVHSKALFSGLCIIYFPFWIIFIAGYAMLSSYNFFNFTFNDYKENPIYIFPLLLYFTDSLVLTALVGVINISYVKLYKNNEEITIRSLGYNSKKYILRVFVTFMFVVFILTLVSFICMIPMLIFPSLVFISIPLLIFSLIFLIVRYGLVTHFIVLEDLEIGKTFQNSFNLTKNDFLIFFLSILAFGGLSCLLFYLFQISDLLFTSLAPSTIRHSISGLIVGISFWAFCFFDIGTSILYYSKKHEIKKKI